MDDIMRAIADANPRKAASELVKGDMFRYQLEAGGRREGVEVRQDAIPPIDPERTVTVPVEIIRTGDYALIKMHPTTSVEVQ